MHKRLETHGIFDCKASGARPGTMASSGSARRPCSTSWTCRTALERLALADVSPGSCGKSAGTRSKRAASRPEAFAIKFGVCERYYPADGDVTGTINPSKHHNTDLSPQTTFQRQISALLTVY